MQDKNSNTQHTTFTDVLIRMLKVNSDMNDAQQHLSNSGLFPQAWWELMQEEAGEIGKEASKFARYFEADYAKKHNTVPHLHPSRASKKEILECFLQEMMDFSVCVKYAMDLSFPNLDAEEIVRYIEEYTQFKLNREYSGADDSQCPHLNIQVDE